VKHVMEIAPSPTPDVSPVLFSSNDL